MFRSYLYVFITCFFFVGLLDMINDHHETFLWSAIAITALVSIFFVILKGLMMWDLERYENVNRDVRIKRLKASSRKLLKEIEEEEDKEEVVLV